MQLNKYGFAPILILVGVSAGILLLTIIAFLYFRSNSAQEVSLIPSFLNQPITSTPAASLVPASANNCSKECQQIVDQKLQTFKQELIKSIEQNNSINPVQLINSSNSSTNSASSINLPKEYYVYFGVNGSSNSTSFSDLAGSDINFDLSNYPRG
jgi:hypothetical protein